MTKARLTRWFKPGTRPARPGVYLSTVRKDAEFYRLWDGKNWHRGGPSPDEAIQFSGITWLYQDSLHWRGLAKKPEAA